MVPPPSPKPVSNATARRKLNEKVQTLGTRIEKQKMGSAERLETLRQQASLVDEREALREALRRD